MIIFLQLVFLSPVTATGLDVERKVEVDIENIDFIRLFSDDKVSNGEGKKVGYATFF